MLVVSTLIIAVIISNPEFLVQRVFIDDGVRDVQLNQVGHRLFSAYFLSLAAVIFYWIISRYKESRGFVKIQVENFSIAGVLVLALGMFFNLILPEMGTHKYVWLGPYFSVLITLSVVYTIRFCNKLQ
ncbi:hypothetical protein HY224_00865 [Candidatus Uhrbacteria bacterium]|nr:hypothetical protein [Candidatus Uhrbacteria bacterium]